MDGNWGIHRKYLMKAPELYKRIPARKRCVTDVLCNWEMNSQTIKMCVIILGPIVRIVNLLRIVNVLLRSDLLSRNPFC